MKKNIILFLIIGFLSLSCQMNIDSPINIVGTDLPTDEYEITVYVPQSESTGSRSISVSYLNITAKRSGFMDVETTLSWNGSAYTGSLNISAGEWIVSAEALNSSQTLVYSGQAVFNTSSGSNLMIRLGHECGSLNITTDTFSAGSMDSFQVTASRSGFDSVIESVQIGPEQTTASLYLLNLTSGEWNVQLSLLNGGYTYYSYAYNVSVTTNELTERTLPLTPFQSKVLPVQFTPSDGVYPDGGSVNVTLSCATPNAQIKYILNGDAPTQYTGQTYNNSIYINTPTTIRAIAFDYSGMAASEVTEILFQPILPEVIFDIPGGDYTSAQTVSLSCSATSSGASIYYVMGGESFENSSGTLYSGPIPVNVSTSIRAVARKTWYHDSPVVGNTYTLQMPEVTISPDGGTFSETQTVSLSSTNVGEGIYYTTDGSYPTSVNGTYYSGSFILNQDTTIRAAAVKAGWASTPAEAVFNIFITPTLTSPTGGVSINDTTPLLDWGDVGAAISYKVRYALSTDNLSLASEHTVTDSEYQIQDALSVNSEYSWQVQALKTGRESEWSDVGTFIVEIDGGITVVPHNDVIDISLNLEDGLLEIVTGEIRIVSATTDPVADSFQWYLNGEFISEQNSSTFVIDDNLSEGVNHTLTVIAIHGNTMASKSIVFEIDFILALGVFYQGGLIFYLDGAGGGLVAAETDQSIGIQWRENTDPSLGGATSFNIGTGKTNTDLIVDTFGSGSYAAKICDDLNLESYDDWFLPSKNELYLMYQNLHLEGLGGFSNLDVYWSSSEYDNTYQARTIYFSGGYSGFDEMYESHYVRAVRSF
ncbi:MAG: chitobiase/beta-hexosaminidase C-terminal domain-containing protein [Spirochaetales bacterium]|nr:chitobiase/beta-hexosaminidase C-terminal domain-containing protein [Spirochaetales bacterium]